MANAITIFRMTASIVLLFCPVLSPAFYVFYIMAAVVLSGVFACILCILHNGRVV